MVDGGSSDSDDGWDQPDSEMVDDNVMVAPNYMHITQKKYQWIHVDQIRKRILTKLEELVDLFVLSKDELLLIARYFKWDKEAMMNIWFAKQNTLQYQIGLQFD